MILSQEDIARVIVESLREEGVSVNESEQPVAELRLLGEGALLKSVGLVSLLVGVEQRLAHQCGIEVALMDERAMSQTRSPFRTVGTLANYIAEITREPTR